MCSELEVAHRYIEGKYEALKILQGKVEPLSRAQESLISLYVVSNQRFSSSATNWLYGEPVRFTEHVLGPLRAGPSWGPLCCWSFDSFLAVSGGQLAKKLQTAQTMKVGSMLNQKDASNPVWNNVRKYILFY